MNEQTDRVLEQEELVEVERTINSLVEIVHRRHMRWWKDLFTNQPIKRNVGEMLMLTVSELSEALEGHRKSLPDDHLPGEANFPVEIADALIRLFDLAGGLNLPLGRCFALKLDYNSKRADHTAEARRANGGKKY